MTSGLGTPTNRAYREAAIADEVPQVLIQTGDPIFSNAEESPWQLGFVPIYQNEGAAFGELLASSSEDHKVAILSQNDDYGEGYVEGFKEAIEGADNIEIVDELTLRGDRHRRERAAHRARRDRRGRLLQRHVDHAARDLVAAQDAGARLAAQLVPALEHVEPRRDPHPRKRRGLPRHLHRARSRSPRPSPTFAESEEGAAFLSNLAEYADFPDVPQFPHCVWSYQIGATLEQVFAKMTEPTRADFMEQLRTISDFTAPLMLEGASIDTTQDGQPAISGVTVQKYNGAGYATAETFG